MSLLKCVVCGNDTDMDEEDHLPIEYGFCVEDELCSTCRIIYSMAGGDVSHHGEADDSGDETERYEGGKAYVIQKCREYVDRREHERYLSNEGREPIEFEGHTYNRYIPKNLFECNVCGNTDPKSCVEIDGVKHCLTCAISVSRVVGYSVCLSVHNLLEPFPLYPWDEAEEIVQVPEHILEAFNASVEQYKVFLGWAKENVKNQYEE